MNHKQQTFLALVKKEFMNNVRNKWIFILGLIFVGVILLTSAYGGLETRGETGIKGYEFTMSVGHSIVILLCSVVAIMLGYKAVTEEVESGNMGLLLTSKLNRKDIVVAKFVGLGSVLFIAVIGGLGIGGLIIGLTASFEGGLDYLYFIMLALLFSLAYLALAFSISSIVKKRSHALTGGIFLWLFFNIIYDLVLFGILIASGWSLPDFEGGVFEFTYPAWYWFAGLTSPNMTYSAGVFNLLNGTDIPSTLNIPVITGVLIVWIVIPLWLTLYVFDRKNL